MLLLRYIFIILLFINSVFLLDLYGAAGWDNSVLVSSDKYINKYPDTFQDDERTLITWTSYKKKIPFIYFNYKDRSWHKPEQVARINKNKIIYPAITFKQGKVFIIISDEKNILQLFYKDINSKHPFKKITLSSKEKFSILPDVYNINNNIFLFYQEYINKKEFKINYLEDIKTTPFSYEPKNLITVSEKEYGSFFPIIQHHKDNIYAFWVDRHGKDILRNDVIYLKYSSDDLTTWSKNIILSENDKDAKFPNFIIHNNILYVIYYVKEETTYIVTKAFDLDNFNLLFSNKLELKFSDFYNLKLEQSNNKFYIFWYSYIKKSRQIFSIESDNFQRWSPPLQFTSRGNNKLTCSVSKKNLAVVYEKKFKGKTLIYYQEKDVSCSPPVLYSTTHKSDRWSYKNSVIFKWKDPYDISGIKGYAYLLDRRQDTIPEIENLPSNFNGKSFEDLGDGIYYLHLRTIDGADNFSPVAHYKIMINTSILNPPEISSPTHKEFIPDSNSSPELNWKIKNNRPVKGYSYLLTQEEELIPDKKINTKKTDIKFINIKEGIWYFKIRACDPYNRWSDYSTFTLSIEKMITATKVPQKIIQEEDKSRHSYIVKPGDVLSDIINKILKIQNKHEWREYEKSIGRYNYLQNLDFLKPGDIIMFPIIIAKPYDTIETISRDIYGTETQKKKIVIIGADRAVLSAGDRVLIKDKYFLKTGKIPSKN